MSEVAEVLDTNKLKRVPVVRDGVVVGIISRGDLVRALSQVSVGEPVEKSDDATLATENHGANPQAAMAR